MGLLVTMVTADLKLLAWEWGQIGRACWSGQATDYTEAAGLASEIRALTEWLHRPSSQLPGTDHLM